VDFGPDPPLNVRTPPPGRSASPPPSGILTCWPQATGSWCRMSCSPAQSAGGRSTIAVEAPRRPEPPGAETS